MKITGWEQLAGLIKEYHPTEVYITCHDLTTLRLENEHVGFWMLDEPGKLGFKFNGVKVYCKDYKPPSGVLDLTGDNISFFERTS